MSVQLGHADVGVTTRHYARWCGGDTYRAPLALEPGEVSADLLARLGGEDREVPTRVPTSETAEVAMSPNPSAAPWKSGARDGVRTRDPQLGNVTNTLKLL